MGRIDPYLWFLLISALAAAPRRWGVWAARVAVHGMALWFILQMDHITGLIGLVGLLLLLDLNLAAVRNRSLH